MALKLQDQESNSVSNSDEEKSEIELSGITSSELSSSEELDSVTEAALSLKSRPTSQ